MATATITDDDPAEPPPPPPPALSIDDLTVAEDAGQARFTVSLSKRSNATVTVAYATSDGSAHAGSDYTAATGSLTFQPGATVLHDCRSRARRQRNLKPTKPSP